MAAKQTRKELLKDPDRFLTFSERVIEWVTLNRKTAIIIASCFVAVIIAGIAGRMIYQSGQKSQRLAFQQAVDLAASAGSNESAVRVLSDYLKKYPRSAQAPLAHLSMARLYFDAGDLDRAVEHFDRAITGMDRHPEFLPLAVLGAASALEAKNHTDQAIARLRAFKDKPSNYALEETLFQLVRLYLLTGDAEKAKSMGEELLKQFPASDYVEYVKTVTNLG